MDYEPVVFHHLAALVICSPWISRLTLIKSSIANRGCYHIDLGAERKMNGSVIHNFSPLFDTKETEAALRALQFERLECDKPFPVALHTRRDWVLD